MHIVASHQVQKFQIKDMRVMIVHDDNVWKTIVHISFTLHVLHKMVTKFKK